MQLPPETLDEFERLAERLRLSNLKRGVLLSTVDSQDCLAEIFGYANYSEFKQSLGFSPLLRQSTSWPDGAVIYQKQD